MSVATFHETLAQAPEASGAISGAPAMILRLEGALAMTVAAIAYSRFGQGWIEFAALFLVPDLSMLGYLAGRRIGAAAYNAGHSYLAPAALGAVGLAGHLPMLVGAALIWVAHIGFDRLLGYGLKYGSGFGDTHLGLKSAAK
jgi:hypothetical protein